MRLWVRKNRLLLSGLPAWKILEAHLNKVSIKIQVIQHQIKWYFKTFKVIWQNIDYNIGNGFGENTGKFTAPVDGIYFFYSQSKTYGSKNAEILLQVNGSSKAYARRDEDGEHDTVTVTAQYKLQKGDIVNVYFYGYFYNPSNSNYAYFEGHLIRQIND